MADPLSITVGVLSTINGVGKLFTTCVDLFNFFGDVRSYGKDHAILSTQLDIEKTLLLQWGQQVNLFDDVPDPRLSDPATTTAVVKALNCIKILLEDTEKLNSNYCLSQEIVLANEGYVAQSPSTISNFRLKNMLHLFPRFQQLISESEKQTSTVRKSLWVVFDKTKFGELLSQLDWFIRKLGELVPVRSTEQLVMAVEDLSSLSHDLEQLELVEDASRDSHPDWAEIASEMASVASVRPEAVSDAGSISDVAGTLSPANATTYPEHRPLRYQDPLTGTAREAESFYGRPAPGNSPDLTGRIPSHVTALKNDAERSKSENENTNRDRGSLGADITWRGIEVPDDGRPITIATGKKRRPSGKLSKSQHHSQTSFMVEIFEAGKGQDIPSRPSVRVKVHPSTSRKSGEKGDGEIAVTEAHGSRKPSYRRRISLGTDSPKQAVDVGSISSLSSLSEESRLAHHGVPIEVEVLPKEGTERSGTSISRTLQFIVPSSDISSMPADSMLEGNPPPVITRPERSRSLSREEVDEHSNLKTPIRKQSRSLSRERLTQKVLEKLANRPQEVSSSSRKFHGEKSSSQRGSKDHSDADAHSYDRLSSRQQEDASIITGAESSIHTNSALSGNRKSGDQISFKFATSKSSVDNPKLLDAFEDVLRRVIMPELKEVKKNKNRQRESRRKEAGLDSPSERNFRRRESSNSLSVEEDRRLRRKSKDRQLRNSAAGALVGGTLTVAALQHHDLRSSLAASPTIATGLLDNNHLLADEERQRRYESNLHHQHPIMRGLSPIQSVASYNMNPEIIETSLSTVHANTATVESATSQSGHKRRVDRSLQPEASRGKVDTFLDPGRTALNTSSLIIDRGDDPGRRRTAVKLAIASLKSKTPEELEAIELLLTQLLEETDFFEMQSGRTSEPQQGEGATSSLSFVPTASKLLSEFAATTATEPQFADHLTEGANETGASSVLCKDFEDRGIIASSASEFEALKAAIEEICHVAWRIDSSPLPFEQPS
ncbi:hypothetical protein GJ744_004563 [Endocarpon pusillum]|uniref:Prion-inhibition and propagation HeLo domain-containing protein n=1 Tax=Endocarpon pusillum TaxID=364733 RepID=A0A8H7E5M9_9EURO|nr:hypothetical protein GJ744_004563 [Endocarpon pusillum]